MNFQELSQHLRRECFQPSTYHIGTGWNNCVKAVCLDRIGGHFEVFFVENGERKPTFYRYETESEAGAAFLDLLESERFAHSHCAGFFTVLDQADALAARLTAAGLRVHRDAIPFGNSTEVRYRIFVPGQDKTRVQELLAKDRRAAG
jgi:hypothetical protein